MCVSSSEVSIRGAADADAAKVEACVRDAYQHYVERIGQMPGPMLEDYRQVIRDREVFVVERAGQIEGVLVLMVTEEGFLLDNVAVSPRVRGQGVGRRLLELAEERARADGFASIYLYTHERMTENRALYARIGYVEYDRRAEKGRLRVYMRKQLARPAP